MKWITAEVHTHTLHSDASLRVAELIAYAKEKGLDAFALTDHNTDSGMDDVPNGQMDPVVIPGIEWTTFFGHVVILAPERFVEWRDLTKDNLDAHLAAVHAAGGVAIMSHPCDPGEPFCCGCHWDFNLQDWDQLDAIEVWHDAEPATSRWNAMTKALWTQKLTEGRRLTALSSTDWHERFAPEVCFGVNYILIDPALPINESFKEAVRHGRTYFTAGPVLEFFIEAKNQTVTVGGSICADEVTVHIKIEEGEHEAVWKLYEVQPEYIALINNEQETLYPFPGYGVEMILPVCAKQGYIRMELRGKIHRQDCDIAVTNPIFVE